MITKPNLEAKGMYEVGTVKYAPDGTTIIPVSTPDMKNSDVNTLDTTASSENLSAKYKYPNVSQSKVPMPSEQGEPNI